MQVAWKFPKKLKNPLFGDYEMVFLHGGRGGSKSWSVGLYFIYEAIREKHNYLCLRQVQNSIKDSVHQLLKNTIENKGGK